jgi:hypothetical protein
VVECELLFCALLFYLEGGGRFANGECGICCLFINFLFFPWLTLGFGVGISK